MTAPQDTTIWSLMGPLLKHHRQLAGFTQQQLAERLHTSQEYVCSRELGRGGLTVEMLYRWAAATECSATDLMPVDEQVRAGLQPRQPPRRQPREGYMVWDDDNVRVPSRARKRAAKPEPEPAPVPPPVERLDLAPKKRVKRSGLSALR